MCVFKEPSPNVEMKKKKKTLETIKFSYKAQRAEEATSHLQSFYAMNHTGKNRYNNDDDNNNQRWREIGRKSHTFVDYHTDNLETTLFCIAH